MATRRKALKARRADIPLHVWNWLIDENPDETDEHGNFSYEIFMLEGEYVRSGSDCADKLQQLWRDVESDVLDSYIAKFPGYRPRVWWWYSAPRMASGQWLRCFWDGRLPEPRLQVSGNGSTPWDAGFAYVPCFEYGIPKLWVGFDPKNRPCFESQAAYLRRHNLLTQEEKRTLKPGDFESEYVDIPEVDLALCLTPALNRNRSNNQKRARV